MTDRRRNFRGARLIERVALSARTGVPRRIVKEEDIMYANYIGRLAALAMLASVHAAASAANGQAGNAQQPKETAAQGAKAAAPATGQKTTSGKAPEVVFMLVPIAVANKENAMRSGCWARIHSAPNYGGDTLTLTGPVSLADMSGPYGLNWDDKVDSLEMGPKATLTVFDNEGFRDQVGVFKPGQKVPDITKRLGFFDEFASVRLTCATT